MATYFDEHADLAIVQSRRVAVLGDDAEPVIHAMLLRDSGVDVHLGTTSDSRAARAAETEGLLCIDAATAVAEADLVVVTKGAAATGVLLDAARPAMATGTAVVVVDALTLRYGALRLPVDSDVVLVAPIAAAEVVEREFAAGRGVPAVVAVEVDASGEALALALAYAKAIGGTRAGAIGATVTAAAETVLFGQTAVVGGTLEGLVAGAFDVLVAAGYPRDLAYIACVHSLHTAIDSTYRGVGGKAGPIEGAARRSGGARLVDAGLQKTLQAALDDVRASKILAPDQTPPGGTGDGATVQPAVIRDTPLEAAGRRVRRLMPWITANDQDVRHAR